MLEKIVPVNVRTAQRVAEVSWFNDIIGGDTEYLGVLDEKRRSSFEHCRDITLAAERLGFSKILLPSAYTVGQDVLTFASGVAPFTSKINLLAAIRTGEVYPPMLARALASLDHMLKGRLTINIINSDLPGLREDPALRYQRCAETIEILKQAWTQEYIDFKGDLYQVKLPADPVKPWQQNGGPLLYFGGTSDGARDICARYCDTFLMWPETEESMYETMQDMSARAASYGRTIDFGLRIHVVVREHESEARAYTKRLLTFFNEQRAAEIRARGEDSRSLGVIRQDEMRKYADAEGFIEPHLWTTIGKVFSGCGGGLVGDPDQIVAKLNRYLDMGIRAFIFSGFPLIEEAEYFARYVLNRLPNVSLSELHQRVPLETPVTPLTSAVLH
ncbi:LLM class flavin-dependent oxidoreductase [Pararcticibacter amylolyticus]|uniref:Alkanesulfonate monooxygenase n=1 Tax=Pararcticibacter amylolyticus TaxID=2173175 RepID=A0A2U2PAJ4_9SPHI|nr:LLM class flavin-dependent oxidoreductase [Pararcticibacter amylolyticus]PWG78380.1 alkanesulfonate monooxygenase [Pararcticibacter amylolyticus]